MVFSLLGTAYADIHTKPVAIQEIIQNDENTNSFVDFIIDTINSIFGLVYDLQDNPKLNQWGNQVIQDSAQRTQDQMDSQLGITHDISKIKAESDKILNP
jgi:DNA-binding MltR family transcriptional regulator